MGSILENALSDQIKAVFWKSEANFGNSYENFFIGSFGEVGLSFYFRNNFYKKFWTF